MQVTSAELAGTGYRVKDTSWEHQQPNWLATSRDKTGEHYQRRTGIINVYGSSKNSNGKVPSTLSGRLRPSNAG